jgi:hypothetical protein
MSTGGVIFPKVGAAAARTLSSGTAIWLKEQFTIPLPLLCLIAQKLRKWGY